MIIRQTTTLVFEYPQDYLQEQEWCKTKADRWVHKGTDTICSVYENKISYSIGQPQTEPTSSKMEQVDKDTNVRSKDERQTGKMMTEEEFDSMLARVLAGKDEPQTYKPTCNGECRNCEYRAKDGNYCMKTDCAWK